MKDNLNFFDNHTFDSLLKRIKNVILKKNLLRKNAERLLADELERNISGFGPKQARNCLQHLGVTQFEIPIDSRITKYFEANHGWFISNKGLSDQRYYHLVLDSIQELCIKAKILPCLFDSAVFND